MYQEFLVKTRFYNVQKFPFLKILKFALNTFFLRRNLTNFVTPDLKLYNQYYKLNKVLSSFHVCAFLIFSLPATYVLVLLFKTNTILQKKNVQIAKNYVSYNLAFANLLPWESRLRIPTRQIR